MVDNNKRRGQELVSEEGLYTTPDVIKGTLCEGCGGIMALKTIINVLGKNTVVSIPASCMANVSATQKKTSFRIPFVHTLFGSAPAVSTGLKAAYDALNKKDINIVTIAGDSGSLDIGFQALSGQASRNDNVLHICYDNEAAMATGGQVNSTSPNKALTLTTPMGSPFIKKNGPAIMVAHRIPYVATASISHVKDLELKIRKAMKIHGMKYIHILAPCPISWDYDFKKTEEMANLAVKTGLWMLYEVESGSFSLTYKPSQRISVREFFESQGRYSLLTEEDINTIQNEIDNMWRDIDERD
ncbi:MAG TPA: thiamine pyrophosphate-dependent enzyme [Nitrospinota bacterium]|nr:thiamine pyrophosphate-dependent enzyme [Nitrospinota bacterium]